MNRDNVEYAVHLLNEFTHNWCMNCAETEKQNNLVFRCGECPFNRKNGKCSVKIFKHEKMPSFKNFGSMGEH